MGFLAHFWPFLGSFLGPPKMTPGTGFWGVSLGSFWLQLVFLGQNGGSVWGPGGQKGSAPTGVNFFGQKRPKTQTHPRFGLFSFWPKMAKGRTAAPFWPFLGHFGALFWPFWPKGQIWSPCKAKFGLFGTPVSTPTFWDFWPFFGQKVGGGDWGPILFDRGSAIFDFWGQKWGWRLG